MKISSIYSFSVLLCLFFLFTSITLYSQIAPTKFFIEFSDKNNSPYTITNPSEFLSQRSIERRINQGIPIDWFDLPVIENYVQQIASIGVIVLAKSKWMNGVIIQINDTSQLSIVNSLPFVISNLPIFKTEESVSVSKWKVEANTEILAKNSNELSPTDYGQALNQINMVAGLGLHNAGFKGQGKLIAVLDAGFPNVFSNPAFSNLNARNGIIGFTDIVSLGNNPTQSPISAHGSFVLSIMAANIQGEMIGTAPEADYLLIRTEDDATENLIEEYNWVIGAEYADSAGADIINSSLGYNLFSQSYMNHTFSDMDGKTNISTKGANKAASKGMLVSISAGNEGNSSWGRICSPADADSCLANGAVDFSGNYASLSSRGPSADGDVKPNIVAQGFATAYVTTQGDVLTGNGTSFSSPIVSGMAACLWQAVSSMKSTEIKQIIEQSASQFANPDSLIGYGIPNFSLALTMVNSSQPENILKDEFQKIHPNPFNGEFDMQFYSSTNQDIFIEVSDITGKLILRNQKKVFKNIINSIQVFSSLEWHKGMYFVSIQSNSGTHFQHVIKN